MLKLKLPFILILIVLTISCAGPGMLTQDIQQFPEPEENMGIVYFYRPSSLIGAIISYDIYLDQQRVGRSINGKYFYLMLEPNQYHFSAQTESKEEVWVKVEEGKAYYVKTGVNLGLMVGRPDFQQIPEYSANEEIRACRYTTIINK